MILNEKRRDILRLKRLLIVFAIILTLTIGIESGVGYCVKDHVVDPEPWDVEPGTLQN